MAPASLRLGLLRLLLPSLVVVLTLGALAAYILAWGPATEAYDQSLGDAALALVQRLRNEGGRVTLDLPNQAEEVLRTDQFDSIYFLVRDAQGQFISGDADVPGVSAAPPANTVSAYDGTYRGRPVRVAALGASINGAKVIIYVAETTVKRERLKRSLLFAVLVPETLLLIVTVALVWYAVGRGLAPLSRLQHDIAARSHRDLAPIDETSAPDEVRPLVRALNALLARVREATGAQRRFIADAAHQLRTPLAALQTQLEVARKITTPEALAHTMGQLATSVSSTARLANQLLALARAEPGGVRLEAFGRLDLRKVAEVAVEEWVRRALAKDIDLGFDLHPAPIIGEPLLVGELLANLLDNAIAYTDISGKVTLTTRATGVHSILMVEDNGRGIPANERGRVVQRFYRVPGTAGTGSGLGLAIVAEIALAHGARVTIGEGDGGRGTCVTVTFISAS